MELAGRDKRVEYRRHAINRGHVATYNEGLQWAAGDYTILLSADDLLTPGALSRAVKLLHAHPEVGLVYGRGIVFRSDQPPSWARPVSEECGWKVLTGSEFLESCCAEGSNLICTPTAIVRTRLQKELGGYRDELPHTCDMEMWMRFAVHAHVGVLDADQAYYRIHSRNMSLEWFDTVLPDLKQRKAAFDALFRDYGHRLPGVEKLHRLAANAVATDALDEAYSAFYKRDVESCRKLVDLAVSACPDARSWRLCRRLIWMLRTGPKTWSFLRRLASRIALANLTQSCAIGRNTHACAGNGE